MAAFAALLAGCALVRIGSSGARVIHASADDCKVIAEVGKAKLDWAAEPGEYRFLTRYILHDGEPYVEDCPWHELGVAPVPEQSATDAFAYITRPTYSGDEASVEIGCSTIPGPGKKGQTVASYSSRQRCAVHRSNGRWHFVGCRTGPIT